MKKVAFVTVTGSSVDVVNAKQNKYFYCVYIGRKIMSASYIDVRSISAVKADM
jgi:hypothetical protein